MLALLRIAPRFAVSQSVVSHRLFAAKLQPVNDGLQFNEAITSDKVLLIDEDKTKLGELPLKDAIAHARAKGKDIVAVLNAHKPGTPRVCKVVAKDAYQAEYRLKNDIPSVAYAETKNVEIKSKISIVDLETKITQYRRVISKHHPIQFTLKVVEGGSDIIADKALLEIIINRLSDIAHEKNFAQTWTQRKLIMEPGKPKAPYVPVKDMLPPSFVDPFAKKELPPKKFGKAPKNKSKGKTKEKVLDAPTEEE